MQKFTNSLQLVGGALVALILAPVVALFGLTVLGLAIGAAALMTGTMSAMIWQQNRDTETENSETKSELAGGTEAQPA